MARSKLAAQLTTLTSLSSTAVVWYILFSNGSLFYSLFHPLRHPVRFVALVLSIILNIKSLPFIWHLRLLNHTLYHYRQRHKIADAPDGNLFKPIVTKGLHSPLYECDYNLHKSNSTYFSDADQARTMLMTTIARQGMATSPMAPTNPAIHDPSVKNGRVSIALGAVSCHFKREVAPYERYDMFTRILAWDRKWVYMITHFVREGAVKPKEVILQPQRTGRRTSKKSVVKEEELKKAVFAVSVAKYVIKKGRLTIAPAEWLEQSGVLPKQADGNGVANGQSAQSGKWTVEDIEARRLRGMEYAEKFAALDELQEQWPIFKNAQGEKVSAVEDDLDAISVLDEQLDMLF